MKNFKLLIILAAAFSVSEVGAQCPNVILTPAGRDPCFGFNEYKKKYGYYHPCDSTLSIIINTSCYQGCVDLRPGGGIAYSQCFRCDQPDWDGLLTLQSFPCNPFRVSFASYDAKRTGAIVTQSWVTDNEVNTKGFTIQKNQNGTWDSVGFVSTKASGGNSSTDFVYTFTEMNLNKDSTRYRLKGTDKNGHGYITYSKSRTVGGVEEKIIIYPNPPVDGTVNLAFTDGGTKKIKIVDLWGRIVLTKETALNLEKIVLPGKGLYLVEISIQGGRIITKKIIVN